ncbi:hypothetical protein CIW66_06410 [Enterobacter cloacae]|nr:hypothetical protein CIW67_09075 [Enterobacter cloacae]PAN88241.1 hypothetical protein CIW66_06410 [Enterobacter cloacae]PAO01200.1 hypothetical protein CIW63_03530 [Enterobacter cloacae]
MFLAVRVSSPRGEYYSRYRQEPGKLYFFANNFIKIFTALPSAGKAIIVAGKISLHNTCFNISAAVDM